MFQGKELQDENTHKSPMRLSAVVVIVFMNAPPRQKNAARNVTIIYIAMFISSVLTQKENMKDKHIHRGQES